MSMSKFASKFDYLLNAFEQASQSKSPAAEGYADKRRAVLEYVRELERSKYVPRAADRLRGIPEAMEAAGAGTMVCIANAEQLTYWRDQVRAALRECESSAGK